CLRASPKREDVQRREIPAFTPRRHALNSMGRRPRVQGRRQDVRRNGSKRSKANRPVVQGRRRKLSHPDTRQTHRSRALSRACALGDAGAAECAKRKRTEGLSHTCARDRGCGIDEEEAGRTRNTKLELNAPRRAW